MPPLFWIAKYLSRLLFWLLTRCKVTGKENVPLIGPLILVCNHLQNADTALLVIAVPRGIVFMAKKELFGFWSRPWVRGVGAFPVRRGGVDRAALRQALQVLTRGLALGIYPEGSRSLTGRMRAARPGVALIAYHSHAPILPVGITGSENIRGFSWLFRRPLVTVNIGRPFTPPLPAQLTKETLVTLADTIMRHVAELLPLSYQGQYTQQEKLAQPTGGTHGS